MRLQLAACLIAVCGAAPLAGQELPYPESQLDQVIAALITAVAPVRNDLEQNSCLAFELVERHLRREFDLHTAGELILDRYWPEDPADQERFVAAFADSLVATYGDLVRYFDEETLRILPLDRPPVAPRLRLYAVMSFHDGEMADIVLRLAYDGDRWRIFDIQAETFSYAKYFQSDFQFEMPEIGFDGLIERLQEEAAPLAECGLARLP